MNGAVAPAVHLLKLDEPRFCIRQAHLVNALFPECFFFQNIDYRLVPGNGIVPDTRFQGHILLHQFQHRVIAAVGYDVVKQIRFNLLFFLSQRKFPFLAFWHWVVFVQTPTVHIFLFSVLVNVTEPIPPVCTLVLAFMQNSITVVSSFFTH